MKSTPKKDWNGYRCAARQSGCLMDRPGSWRTCLRSSDSLRHIFFSHQILQFTPRHKHDFEAIRNIGKELNFEPDFLTRTSSFGKSGSILLYQGTNVDQVVRYFEENSIENEVSEYIQPVAKKTQKLLKKENISSLVGCKYLSYSQQSEYIAHIGKTLGTFVKTENIGNTIEGRNISAIKFGFPGNNKPIFWVNAGIHAREWIGHSTAFYFINQLTTNPEWLEILKKIDIIVTPNANPDGYEYSRTTDRLWRTNRKMKEGGQTPCYGIDINRNFPFKWKPSEYNHVCQGKTSYPGNEPASELETQALTEAMEKTKDRIKGFVDLHSAGEVILYPWGYAYNTYPADVEDLKKVAFKMQDAIRQFRGKNYTVMNSADLYPASGASNDFAKSLGIKYVYRLELSGTYNSKNLWDTPESWIEPVAEEIINALKVLAKQIVSEFTV